MSIDYATLPFASLARLRDGAIDDISIDPRNLDAVVRLQTIEREIATRKIKLVVEVEGQCMGELGRYHNVDEALEASTKITKTNENQRFTTYPVNDGLDQMSLTCDATTGNLLMPHHGKKVYVDEQPAVLEVQMALTLPVVRPMPRVKANFRSPFSAELAPREILKLVETLPHGPCVD